MTTYEVTTDTTRFGLEAAHAFLSQTCWSPGLPRAVLYKAVENSLCFGLLLGVQLAAGPQPCR